MSGTALRAAAAAAAFACCSLPASAGQVVVTPVEKVLQMLGGMVAKAKAELHEEQVSFAGFQQFCSDVTLEKENAVRETSEQLEFARTAVQTHDTEAARLATEIHGHVEQATSLQADKEAALALRAQERKAYLEMRQNYSESLEALGHAISVTKAQNFEREGQGPAALLQEKLGAKQLQALRAASREEPDLEFVPDVPTVAYKPKAGKVVEMLEKLQDEFRGRSTTLNEEETDRQHSFEMVLQDRADSIKAEEDAQALKTKSRARHMLKSAEASADVKDLAALLGSDTDYLTNLKADCAARSTEYDSRQALRKEELAALGQAVEVISSSKVSGAADKHLPAAALVASVRATSLGQLRKPGLRLTAFKAGRNQMQVAAFLKEASARLHSTALSAIAARAEADPFGKVKQLVEELIQRLMQEATNEAEHKGWCDAELATNAHTRKSRTQEIESLSAEKEGLSAGIAQLGKELAQLAVAINATEAEVAEATALRDRESADNTATAEEAQQAQVAVAEAIKILTEFYGKAAKAKVFVQRGISGKSRQEPPKAFEDGPYQGMQAEHGGVLGLLDVIHSDFVRLQSDTQAAENQAQALYDKFMEESAIAKAQMDSSVKHKTKDRDAKSSALDETTASLESAGQQLALAKAEFDKLQPACLDAGQTYEERVQNRKDEIEALKEALRILEDV